MSATTSNERTRIAGEADASDALRILAMSLFDNMQSNGEKPMRAGALRDLLTGVANVDPAHRKAYATGISTVLLGFLLPSLVSKVNREIEEARKEGRL